MLSWFRNNAKIFLIAVVVIFVGMIFLEWGRGGAQNTGTEKFFVGSVNGEGLESTSYEAVINEVYTGQENQMQRMGDPDPESQLALLYNEINDAAFELLVDRTLQAEYLRRLGWEAVKPSMAEPLLRAQLMLMGVEDAEGYINEYKNDPNYGATLYQMVIQADRTMFDAAVSIQNMISAREVEFFVRDVMTTVAARYIPFNSAPVMPSEAELREFYDANTDLFITSPGARIRYAVFTVQPDDADLQVTLAVVDSLAIAGAGTPDTLTITRSQLEEFAGWNIDIAVGELSEPFAATSLGESMMQACHSVELLSVVNSPEDTTGSSDTLTLVHWEVPLFPGYSTVRESFWILEENAETILASDFPVIEGQSLVDYGELVIDETTVPTAEIPASLISFATDSIWSDSIGPVFYIPSFSGGYPALIVARKLEDIAGGQIAYQEALETNKILLECYTRKQSEESLTLASLALERFNAAGTNLTAWAEAESLEIYDTQEFSPVMVRQWAASDQASYRGILGCSEFADVSLLTPEFTVVGPFVSNGVAYLAEIVSRNEAQIPDNASQIAGFYLSLLGNHQDLYTERLMSIIKSGAEIEDLRVQYYETMDSLRAEYATQEEALQ
jgi:hypothetical protein